MTGWARTARLVPAVGGSAVVLLAGLVTAGASLRITQGPPVPVVWFLLLALVVLATLPLYPSFGVLEPTFARARRGRLLRVAACVGILAVDGAVLRISTASDAVVSWALLVGAIAIVAASVTTDLAWMVALVVGGATLMWEHLSLDSPVTRAMDAVGPAWPVAGLLAASAVFVVRTPPARDEPLP